MKQIKSGFLIASAFASILFYPNIALAQEKQNEILFGSVAMDIPAAMYTRLKPLTDYLSQTLKQPVTLKLSPNMASAIDEVASGNVQLAYLTPVAYLEARKKGHAQLIAKTITNGKGSFRLMIVVRQDSPVKTINDLVGKDFAFGDEKALLQRATVVGAGLPLNKLHSYKFIGHYDNIVRAVISGDFDAGILKDTMAYKWQGKGIRIIYQSPDLPPYNITASRDTSPQTVAELRKAFLALNAKNPAHMKVIKALDKKYDGFAPTSDSEYDVVRKLVAPFKK
ncbi:MAG: PhnD/SsuA/transferrin family substrate-binding protein [Acidiferrobacterales bacterium]